MTPKSSPARKNRRTTRSTKVIRDLPPRDMSDEARRQVRGGATSFSEMSVTKSSDKGSSKL